MGDFVWVSLWMAPSCDWWGRSWRNMATNNCSVDMALLFVLSSLIKMKETSPTKFEVWTENMRKALWQSNPKMTIRQDTPKLSDKTETRFFFPNTQKKSLNP
jgi:hypothetical protein